MTSLRKMREEKGMSQIELAKKINVKSNTISQYESDKRTPNATMLKKIAYVLNCTVDDLLKENIK